MQTLNNVTVEALAGPDPSADDKIRAARFDRLMTRYADLLYYPLKKKSEATGIKFDCEFHDADPEDRAVVLDAMTGDAAAYDRVHGDPTMDSLLAPRLPESEDLGTAVKTASETPPKTVQLHFEAADEEGLVNQLIRYLTTGSNRPTPVVADEIRAAILMDANFGADKTIDAIRMRYKKAVIINHEPSRTFAAQGWADGAGMLPPNVEVLRAPDRDAAALALWRAMTTAFPRSIDHEK